MLTINLFFCLVLQTQLLRNVKASHHIDLAYLYYLPFCSVFTSKDNFHVQIVPLFMNERQTFVHGDEFKEEMKRLHAHYSSLSEEVQRTGLFNFASFPPDDQSFLTTRLWDRYLPSWREVRDEPRRDTDLLADKEFVAEMERINKLADEQSNNQLPIGELDYVKAERNVYRCKGKWRRFSEEQEKKIDSNKHDH